LSQSDAIGEALIEMKIFTEQIGDIINSQAQQSDIENQVRSAQFQLEMYDNENRNLRIERENLMQIITNLEGVNRS
jgi:conjugal transfer/entry exclusion protein